MRHSDDMLVGHNVIYEKEKLSRSKDAFSGILG